MEGIMLAPKSNGLSKKEFCDRMCEAIRARFPDLAVEPAGELSISMRVNTPCGDLDGTANLDRSYAEFCRAPHELNDILQRFVQTLQCGLAYKSLDRETVIPMLKSPGWVRAQSEAVKSFLWTDPYNSDLIVVYAQYRECLMYGGFYEGCGVSFDEITGIAMANLRRMSPTVAIVGTAGFYTVSAGQSWNSSLVLLDELRNHPAMAIRGDSLMAVPDRDSFLIADDSSATAIFQMCIAVTMAYRRAPYPLCPQLFAWRDEFWERLDPQSHDPSQTIVDTAEVAPPEPDGRGGCILPLTIRDPLTKDARSVYRLFLKLHAYLQAAGSMECRRRFGDPDPQSHCIRARIHPSSDPAIKEALGFAAYWLQDGSGKDTSVTLRVEEVSTTSFH